MRKQSLPALQFSEAAQRHEFARLLAATTRIFGLHKLNLALDIVREAHEKASANLYFRQPADPPVFLSEMGMQKVLEAARQPGSTQHFSREVALSLEAGQALEPLVQKIFGETEVVQNRLALLFACCHPALPPDLRLALLLKTTYTFSEKDIEHLRHTDDLACLKELPALKDLVLQNDVQVSVPSPRTFAPRLDEVLKTVWHLFSEGFGHSPKTIFARRAMCDLALQTGFSLSENKLTAQPKIFALMSLMCLFSARFDLRRGRSPSLIFLEEKNRSKWNQALIDRGVEYFERAGKLDETSEFQILAQIVMEHTLAPHSRFTNWNRILSLYDKLLKINPLPEYRLNYAWVLSKLSGASGSLHYMFTMPGFTDLLLADWRTNALLGEFYRLAKNPLEGVKYYRIAVQKAPTTTLGRMLNRKILAVEKRKKGRRRKQRW